MSIAVVFVVVALLFTGITPPCGPQRPDYSWYTIPSIRVIDHPLPAGVTITNDMQEVSTVYVKNTTSIPLYFLGRVYSEKEPVYTIAVTQPSLAPRLKFIDGKAYSWDTPRGKWLEWLVESPDDPYRMNLYPSDWDPSAQFVLPNNEDRPALDAAPPPQRSTLMIVYGNDIIAIPVVTTYALNPNYGIPPEPIPCSFRLPISLIVCVQPILFVLFFAFIIYIVSVIVRNDQ